MLTDMKKYTWLGLVAAAFGLGALGAWVVRPQPTSSQTIYAALPPPQVVVAAAPLPTSAPAVQAAQKAFQPQTVTANGIPVQVTYARVLKPGEYDTKGGIEIGFCYPTRNNGQWYPYFKPLNNNGLTIPPSGGGWDRKNTTTPNQSANGRECAFMFYELDPAQLVMPFTFTIREIAVTPHEGSFCEEMALRLGSSAAAHQAGIVAKCASNADGSPAITLNAHNPNLSDAEAQRILDEEVESRYVGPWTFTIDQLSR
jgi:hypothetical protein